MFTSFTEMVKAVLLLGLTAEDLREIFFFFFQLQNIIKGYLNHLGSISICSFGMSYINDLVTMTSSLLLVKIILRQAHILSRTAKTN